MYFIFCLDYQKIFKHFINYILFITFLILVQLKVILLILGKTNCDFKKTDLILSV